MARKQRNAPLVVGITGIDTVGKTEFALALARVLERRSRPVQLLHLDDFHNPREHRYAGANEPDNYYQRSFDIERLLTDVLRPICADGRLDRTLRLLDLATDRFELVRRYRVSPETIVLFEGVFLLRPELREYLELTILLDMPFDLAPVRARARDVPALGEQVLAKYSSKYLPAQRRHFAEVEPRSTADIVVDNSDWRRPTIVRASGRPVGVQSEDPEDLVDPGR